MWMERERILVGSGLALEIHSYGGEARDQCRRDRG